MTTLLIAVAAFVCGLLVAVVAFVWACGRLASAADALMENVDGR